MDFLARVKSQLDWSDSLREMWVESFRDELDDEGQEELGGLGESPPGDNPQVYTDHHELRNLGAFREEAVMEKFTCREKIAVVIGSFLAYKIGTWGANMVNWANMQKAKREANRAMLRAIVGDDWQGEWDASKNMFDK